MTAQGEPNPQNVLRDEILADARRQAERAVRRAERDAQESLAQARKQADADRAGRLDAARRETERRRNLLLASVPVEEARMRADRLEETLRSVHDEARRRLADRAGDEYHRTLVRLAAEAVAQMAGERFVLALGAEDLKAFGKGLADEVRRAVGRDGLEVSVADEPAKVEAGVLVRDAEGRQVWDSSLAARLERLWPALRLVVGARLLADVRARSKKEP
ncbi:MAG TPA: V-type ATP synthase subunit E family protein [Phycisphaerae bacterium]|nr:V-type ATP synthase subunit E family protein [Phycisphaerae bacterium]